MADKNVAKVQKTNTTTVSTKSKDDVVVSKETTSNRVEKLGWTVERCKKYARRYTSEILWASGSPSSYQSAVAHGWKDICLTEMANAHRNLNVSRSNVKKAA